MLFAAAEISKTHEAKGDAHCGSSRDSKSGRDMCDWQTTLDRHRFQRVLISRPAITANPVGLTSHGENTAEVRMVASKEEIEDSYESRHERSFAVVACPHERSRAFNASLPASCVISARKPNSVIMELNSTLILQVTSHLERIPKFLVLLAVLHAARRQS
jgi:hypothetical protein